MAKSERSSTSRQRSKNSKTKKLKIQDTASKDCTMETLRKNENIANCTVQSNENKSQDMEIVKDNEDQNKVAETMMQITNLKKKKTSHFVN